jgi:hypothetical protein
MRSRRLAFSALSGCTAASLLLLGAAGAFAVPVQVLYTEPPAGTMPQFGTVPFPNNLYYDGGAPGAGDGTRRRFAAAERAAGHERGCCSGA